ncbi:efflux RND transporter periplasmic adaptor subunit [Methylocella sp.]|uniref:efflux RND transporter periplasmic adaptor subunit n=1 Tax=Methylocella sp. TaxID=1978226 RepID=UPI0037841260
MRRTPVRPLKRAIVLSLVFLVLAGLAGGLGYFQFIVKPAMIRQFIAQADAAPTTVAVVPARLETWTPRLPAIGSFRAYQGVDVSPQVGGVVVATPARSGEDVAKGAPLFEIDNFVEQAELKSNLAVMKNAELALARQRQLTDSGNTTKASFDAAEAARDQAAAAVERVRAIITQKQIAAPFAGRLGIRKIDVGQYVSPGASLVTLQQLDPIYVDFPAPEQWLDRLKPGQTIDVEVDSHPGRVFRGKIETIDARVAAESRNVLVRGLFENKDKALLPGMFANAVVEAGEPAAVVVVPRTAVTYSLYGDSVFVAVPLDPPSGAAQAAPATPGPDAKMKLERRFVRLGEARGADVAALDGVKPGELVVSEGQIKVAAGDTVFVDRQSTLTPQPIRPKE